MFEGVLERLLLKLFGEYVEEFNRDQLHVSIWAGDVVLTDLKLKPGALDSLRLPLEVVAGGISTLTLKIPWTRIASAPCQIVIDGLYLIAGPVTAKQTKGAEGDEAAAADPAGVFAAQKLAAQLKSRMLETHEASKRALAESAEGTAASASYSSRMISKIIANLQLTVKHVHVRYEDATTLQGAAAPPSTATSAATSTAVALAAPSSPSSLTSPSAFACGFTIWELVAQTTDSKGEVKFVSGADSTAGSGGEDDPAAVTHKIVALRGGSVYWNSELHASDLWQHLPTAEKIKRMRQMDSTTPTATSGPRDASSGSGRPALPAPAPIAGSPPPSSSSPKLLCDYDYILHPLDITMRAVLHHGDDDRELLRAQETEHLLMQAHSAHTAAASAAAAASGATTAFAFPNPVATPPSSGSSSVVVPSTAKYFFSFTLPHLSLQLRSAQYRDAVRIADHFSQTKVNNTIALRMAKLPRFPPRDRTAAQMAARKRSGSFASSRAGSRPPSPGQDRAAGGGGGGGGGDNDLADNISEADTNDWGDSQSVSATDDDDTDEEFLTPEQAPLNEPSNNDMDSLSLDGGESATGLSAAALSSISSLPSSFAPAPRFFRPAWCRPYWRHACRCLILLKSRRGRMEWSSVQEFGVDRARYIALWMRSYNSTLMGATNSNPKTKAQAKAASASWLPALTASESQELTQLESKLSFESIVVFRLIAEQQWKVQQQAASTMAAPTSADAHPAPAASPPAAAAAAASASSSSSKKPAGPPSGSGSGWWGYLGFKAAEGGSGSSAVDAEAAKLLQSITLTPQQQRAIWEQEQSLPLYFKRLQIHVKLFGADFRLTQPRKGAKAAAAAAAASSAILSPTSPTQLDLRSNRPPEFEVTRLTWDGSLVFVQRLRTWSAAVSVTKLEVIDCCTEATCFPKVISTATEASNTATNAAQATTSKAAHTAPLLSLYLEDSPRLLDVHSSADFRVRLELSPLAFVVSPLYLSAVLRFFSEKDTTAFLWAAAANWEAQARSDLLNALTDHREIDFDLCVHNPTVLLPTDCLRRDSTVLVSDLHLLRMFSKPPVKQKVVATKKHDADPSSLDPFSASPSSSVDANLSYVAPSNPQAYDSFQLHFKDCRLYTCSSVAQWERRNALRLSSSAAAAMSPVDAPAHEELLYIVDGAVNDDARIPAATSAHASSAVVLPRRPSGSSRSLHAHPGFDVSLVMHTCIDKFERLRAKQAREIERARAAQVHDLIARGDHDGLAALHPLPPSKPLSKILIQGSLPFLNISVCASTLQVIRNVKTQLMGLWFKPPKETTGGAGQTQTQEQTDMLQLANESAPTAASAGAGGSSSRAVPVADVSSASKPDAALSSMVQLPRNNLECGFLVDQLVVNILRDRVLRNAKAAAAAAQSASSSAPAAAPMSFLRPKAPPLFLFHITRMGGVFVTSAAREIHSSFQLASIRVLDCLQPFGPGSAKFAYLACSYPIPGSDEAARHDTGDGRSHVAAPMSAGMQPSSSSENLQFSFAQALSRAVAPSRLQVPSTSSSSALSSPSPSSSASSDLIRIRYQYIFTPARNEREWEEEEGGDSEEDFLKQLSKPRQTHSTTKTAAASTSHAASSPPRAEGVSSTIDLDFNTLYVSWNPNTVAAVLAYLRYDESKLAEKETAAVLGGAAGASADAAVNESKEPAESKSEATSSSSRKDASDALYGDSSSAAGPSFSTAPASSLKGPRPNPAVATPSAASKAKKTVRLAPSAPAGPISLTTALSSSWFAAHKNTTVVRARLRRLSVTFNKEAEGRQLMRLEMVHSNIEHRHTVHPSPFLFYLITTKSTAKGKSHPGFISEAAKTSAVAAAGPAGVATLASLSASLSRDPIHTFVTRGSLGNVKLVDLSEDFGIESKYRETFGLREEKARHQPSASVSSPSEEKEDSLASVLDFSFASFQLEVKQRREWAIRKRKEIELQRRRDAGEETAADADNVSPAKVPAATPAAASNLPARFPSQPSFADTHLLLHVNAIRVVYLQQHTMELIDYFNEGILGALQARLRQPSKPVPSPNPATPAAAALPAQDKYNKLSISLSSPELIVPRNSQSDHHLVASIGKVKVSNTLHARRLVLGVDIKALRICSGELTADGTYDARSHSYAAAAAAGASPASIQIRPHRDSPGFVRAPMLDFDCFVTSTLPQPDPLKQPSNEKYFDSILDLDMGTLRGVMSWAQYLLILQVWNENLRAPPPVRQKLHVPVQIVLKGAAGPPLGGAPIPSAIRPPGAAHIVPVAIPARDGVLSPSATPSLTDAPTVIYHVFDERPPLTMDIRLHITLARLRFLVGDGYVSTGSSGCGWREDGLSEISVVDISYVFQKFSSNHMHQTARVASVTMADTRHASRHIPFSKMLCPFNEIRGGGAHNHKQAQPAQERVERVGTVASAAASASVPAPSTPWRTSSLPPPSAAARSSSVNESELVYVQHDYPTGERDMHMSVIKPCGFIIPDFWGEFIFGFLFKANDESILADVKMKQEWERRTMVALASDPANPAGAAPASSPSPRAVTQQGKPASSPRPPLSTTTGVHHAGYTPTPFAGAVRPFRAFNLTLKNSRLILVEDLRYRACRALVTTCDATMNYASFEAVNKPPPAADEPQQSTPWWTSFQWSRIITIRKLRVFVAASAQNPIINAAHSVMTPANLVHNQTSKTEKRYYAPRANMPFHVSSSAAGGAGNARSPASPHSPPELHPVQPPLRLEVRDEQVHDVSLCSSAEGQGFSALSGSISGSVSVGGGEPIEVRASYQDFKLLSHCLDTLAEQQRIKQQERLAREEAEAEQKAAAGATAAAAAATSRDPLDSAPNPYNASMFSDPSKNLGLDDGSGSSGVDSTEDEFEDGLVSPRAPTASPTIASTLPSALAAAMTTFSESATVLQVVWSSQLTLVIINDCFQRYVPLLHARILPGEALWINKRKELDDEADEEEQEDEEDEEEEQITEEETKAQQAAEAEASAAAGGDGTPAPVKLSTLDRARSFLHKLKHGDKPDPSASPLASPPPRRPRALQKKLVDFKTLATTLLLECTFFNPRVVVWEPLVEPLGIEIKAQYETPNIHNSLREAQSRGAFGKVGQGAAANKTLARRSRAGPGARGTGDGVALLPINNVPAWTVHVLAASRVNVNLSYVFLQHLYSTLQSWSEDFQSGRPSQLQSESDSGKSSSSQAFSPYFIRNLTGGEVLYRCRNIIRESAKQAAVAAGATTASSSTPSASPSAAASATSNAFALHDRITLNSEFAANPGQFIGSIGATKPRHSSVALAAMDQNEPESKAAGSASPDQQPDTAAADLDDGLETVHVLAPGAEEQLSLRLISGQSSRKRRGQGEEETSAEDDVYRSILASRAPFSLRVRLAGGWVALQDLVVSKVGTTSYVLQLDAAASTFKVISSSDGAVGAKSPLASHAANVSGAATVLSSVSTPSPQPLGLGLAPAASTAPAGELIQPDNLVITDYFPSADAPKSATAAAGIGSSLAMALQSGAQGGGPAAGADASSSAARALHAAGAFPGQSSAANAALPAVSMLHMTQLERRQLLLVDVSLRDGSKVVTLRAPIELVNRTDRPICFLLHAHPTTARRAPVSRVALAAAASSSGPYPDWAASHSAYLQARDAFAVLGPVAPGQSVHVPFSLTHLDFVSAMPMRKEETASSSPLSNAANQASTLPGAQSAASALLRSAGSMFDGRQAGTHATDVSGSSAGSQGWSYGWSDAPLSQSALMKAVQEQAQRYSSVRSDQQPPGVVAKMQCSKDSTADASAAGQRWRADSSYLLHVQAIHGSSGRSSSSAGSQHAVGGGARIGENVLTLSLVFTTPLVLRNLFPYGIDFRVAYTRAPPASALASQAHLSHSSSLTGVGLHAGQQAQHVLGVGSATQQQLRATAAATAAEKEKDKNSKAKDPKPTPGPSRLDTAHAHTGGKARYELWGHLAPGQHIFMPHLSLDRDPYLMFRLDGLGWSERVPLVHLNANDSGLGVADAQQAAAASKSAPGQVQHDYTLTAFQMQQHVARHHVSLEDSNGNPLVTQLESRRSGPQGGGLELDLFAQYWLLNRTGLDLLYGSRIQQHIEDAPSAQDATHPADVRTLPGHGGRVEVVCYENQRYSVLDGWIDPFLPTDRPAWSDEGGESDRPREGFRLPSDDGSWVWENEWSIDYGNNNSGSGGPTSDSGVSILSLDETDPSMDLSHSSKDGSTPKVASSRTDGLGWEYALDFPFAFHPRNAMMDAVRRRRWVRSYTTTRTLRPLCLHSTNVKGWHEELAIRVAPSTKGAKAFAKEMHTKSGAVAPWLRVRASDSHWSTAFAAEGNSDGLLQITEVQLVDVTSEADLEAAKWKRAAAHVMALADSGLEKGKFELEGSEESLGPLHAHVVPRASYPRRNRYDLGVQFSPCPGLFHRSSLIAFTPRFILVNQLPYGLFFRQAGAHHRGRVMVQSIEAGRFQPLWWGDIGVQPLGAEELIKGIVAGPPGAKGAAPGALAKPTKLTSAEFEARKFHLRSQNADFESLASVAFASEPSPQGMIRWRWTGAFPIDEVGELSLACRSSAMTSRFLRVKVSLDGATVFIAFREEDAQKPKYRIDNATNCPMWYRQKLPYVEENRIQILEGLSMPTPAPPTGAVGSSSPPSSSSSSSSPNPAGSPKPLISADALSPWLYLAPGASTPFAWQELLVAKPYKLEVVTASPHLTSPAAQEASEVLARAAAQERRERGGGGAETSEEKTSPSPPPNSVASFFTRVGNSSSAAATAAAQAKRNSAAAAMAAAEANARARLGPYDFHLADSIQLDEIGYSLVEMHSQTFVDVYVEDTRTAEKDKQSPSSAKSKAAAAASSSSGDPDSSKRSGKSGSTTTKILKLVRKSGLRELGVAEAAALLSKEERAEREAAAARKASTGDGKGSKPDPKDKSVPSAADLSSTPSKQRARAASTAAGESTEDEYVPVHKRELQVERTSLHLSFHMSKFSLSLVDHIPRELALISLRDLSASYSSSNIYQKFELLLGDIQLDNQTPEAMFPVVLHQKLQANRAIGSTATPSEKEKARRAAKGGVQANARRPFLHLSLIRLTRYSSLEHFKYLGFLAQEFVLRVEQSFLLACIPFLDVFLAPRAESLRGEQQARRAIHSLRDLEEELGLPLANEEEYRVVRPVMSAGATASQTLEQEFQSQVDQMAHLRAVLATLSAQLAQERHAAGGHASPNAQTSQSRLEAEIERAQTQYARLAESNQRTAAHIQDVTKRALLAAANAPSPSASAASSSSSSSSALPRLTPAAAQLLEQSLLASSEFPSTPSGGPARSAHVLSTSVSWIEGADIPREEVPTKHGGARSAATEGAPYTGWTDPNTTHAAAQMWRAVNGNATATSNSSAAANSSAASAATLSLIRPTAASASAAGASSAGSLSPLPASPRTPASPHSSMSLSPAPAGELPPLHRRWVNANSNQNANVCKTLTALVNRTLAKLESKSHRKKARNAAASQPSSQPIGGVKHTEDEELDQIYYLESVDLNTVQCTFSFFTLPSSSGHSSGSTWMLSLGTDHAPELLSAHTQALANAISSKTLMIANAEDAHLRVTGLRITHSFITMSELLSLLSAHYQRQLQLQLFELVGSSHALGNPIGLLSNLGTGVFDLVNEPLSGAIRGPAAFGRGVAVGVGSFVKYSVRGVANTASSLLGTLGNASATLSADPDYLRRRKLGRLRQPAHAASGLLHGGRHLAKGMFDGLTGVFTSPVEGAIRGGALGFLGGVGRGLVGVVVKPVTGVFDAVTTLSDGIKNTTTLFDHRVLPQRPPRIMYGPEQLLRVYTNKEISASCFLDTRGLLRLEKHQRETYVDHLAMEMHPSKALLKENELRIKLAEKAEKEREKAEKQRNKDDVNSARTAPGSPTSSSLSPSAPSTPSSSSRSRSGSNASSGGGLGRSSSEADLSQMDESSLHLHGMPSSRHVVPSAITSGGSSSALLPPAGDSSSTSSALNICFCLTDHSFVCLKLDLKGNLAASMNNSSSSSARASTASTAASHVGQSGGHISSLLSSNSGSGANSTAASASTAVSKYARILFSFYWVSILELGRTFVPAVSYTAGGPGTPTAAGSETPRSRSSSSASRDRSTPGGQGGQHLFCIRVQVSSRTAKEIRKNERLKSLFPFVLTDMPSAGADGSSGGASAHFSSSHSFFSRDWKTAPPLILTLQIPCASAADAESLETMCRLAHARAQAEKRADSVTPAAGAVLSAIRRVPSMPDEEQSASILSPTGLHSRLSISHPSASPPAVNFYSPDASPIATTRRVAGEAVGTPGAGVAASAHAASSPLPSFPFSLAMPPAGSPLGAAAAGGAGAAMVAPTPLLRVAQQLHQPGQR